MAVIVALGGLFMTAPVAHAEDPGFFEITKGVDGWDDGHEVAPDETFSYTVEVTCSNTGLGGCTAATLTDPLPDHVLPVGGAGSVVVSGTGGNHDVSISDDNVVTIDFQQPLPAPEGAVGITAGNTVTIVIPVRIDPDIPAAQNGTELVNTATVEATNAETKDATFTVVPEIPINLAATPTRPTARPVASQNPARRPP